MLRDQGGIAPGRDADRERARAHFLEDLELRPTAEQEDVASLDHENNETSGRK